MDCNLSHLNELQLAELNILKVTHDICQRYGLTYYIYGGSLLGAYRHKGFIPWDDDVDIAMPRKDYERLKQLQGELPDYMFLDTIQRKGHQWTGAHIVDTRYKVEVGYGLKKAEMFVWMDILVIDGVSAPGTFKYKVFSFMYLSARLWYKFSNFSKEVDLEKERTPLENFLIKFAKVTHIEKFVNQQIAGTLLDWVSRRYDFDSCDYVAALCGALKMDETIPKTWLGQGRMMQFEDMMVRGLDETEEFLTKIYGEDYMTPPPVDKRNQHAVKLIEV